jgi:hypothetical protein
VERPDEAGADDRGPNEAHGTRLTGRGSRTLTGYGRRRSLVNSNPKRPLMQR